MVYDPGQELGLISRWLHQEDDRIESSEFVDGRQDIREQFPTMLTMMTPGGLGAPLGHLSIPQSPVMTSPERVPAINRASIMHSSPGRSPKPGEDVAPSLVD